MAGQLLSLYDWVKEIGGYNFRELVQLFRSYFANLLHRSPGKPLAFCTNTF